MNRLKSVHLHFFIKWKAPFIPTPPPSTTPHPPATGPARVNISTPELLATQSHAATTRLLPDPSFLPSLLIRRLRVRGSNPTSDTRLCALEPLNLCKTRFPCSESGEKDTSVELLNTSFEQNRECCNHSIIFISHWSSRVYALGRLCFLIGKGQSSSIGSTDQKHSLFRNSHLHASTTGPTIPLPTVSTQKPTHNSLQQLHSQQSKTRKNPNVQMVLVEKAHNGRMLTNKQGQTTDRCNKRGDWVSTALHRARGQTQNKAGHVIPSTCHHFRKENRWVVARRWGGVRGCLQRVPTKKYYFWGDRTVLYFNCGNYTTVCIC